MRSLLLLAMALGCSAASVVTANNDIDGTGANSSEITLTPSNVTTGKFARRCHAFVDGNIFGQILYAPAIASHDLAIAVTMHDSVYAFDVHDCSTVWHVSLGTSWTSYPIKGTFNFTTISEMGCLSTPVLDLTNSLIYVSCMTSTPAWKLFKLNLSNGSTVTSVTISGQVVGTGDTNPNGHANCGYLGHGDSTSGPNLLFAADQQIQRPALKLSGGTIYISFSGFGDTCPYHGWVMTYDTSLSQTGIWCSTPNDWGGGVWGQGALTVDGSGNAYVTTGNGTTYNGTTIFTNSVVKLSPTLSMIGDWFEPSNNVTINADDADVAANRFLLIPGTIYGVMAAKDFNVYVIDTTCMGHLQGSSGCTLQTFQTLAMGTITSSSGSYGATFINNVLYLPTTAGSIYAFTWGGSSFNTTPVFTDTDMRGFPGPAQMAGSSNGGSNGILWVTTGQTSAFSADVAGTLRAINPTTGAEYWNSGTTGNDSLGHLTKFAAPSIADGNVMVPTLDLGVAIYGLVGSAASRGLMTQRGKATLR